MTIESSARCLEMIAEVLETMQDGFDTIIEQTPPEHQERVAETIYRVMKERFEFEDRGKIQLIS